VSTGEHPDFIISDGLEFVGYHDLQGRPAFKMALWPVGDRWYMYLGHFWHRGWSVLDVTDPANPEYVNWIDGPANTWTLQVQAADGLLVTALERIGGPFSERAKIWGGSPDEPNQEGVLFWSLEDPTTPRLLSHFRTGGNGTHRNYYVGGDRAYLAANMAGYRSNIFVSLDVSDPSNPVEVGRWHFPGQWIEGGETPEHDQYLHGPAYVIGDRAYLPYGRAGAVVLDISDETRPVQIGHIDIGSFGSIVGTHSVLPLLDRDLAIVTTEAIYEEERDPMNLVFTVDLTDETRPKPVAAFPTPIPPAELGIADFHDLGGKFGPHNIQLPHGLPWMAEVGDHVHITYESGGMWTYDISNPGLPQPLEYFVPSAPKERRGSLPKELATQTEDIVVDSRGYIYLSDKNHGIFILRDRRHKPVAQEA
jgi:hypothetical protein